MIDIVNKNESIKYFSDTIVCAEPMCIYKAFIPSPWSMFNIPYHFCIVLSLVFL